MDYVLTRADVDAKQLILFGQSFGRLLAIRAVAHDHRFAACIFHGGIFDMYDSFMGLFPPYLRSQLENASDSELNHLLSSVMETNPSANAMIGHGMYVMGVSSAAELITKIKQFTLKDTAHHVTCPTLIIDGTEEHFLLEHGKQLYETLMCPKDYLLFSTEDGAEEHCQVGALAICHERLFNWLKTRSLMFTP